MRTQDESEESQKERPRWEQRPHVRCTHRWTDAPSGRAGPPPLSPSHSSPVTMLGSLGKTPLNPIPSGRPWAGLSGQLCVCCSQNHTGYVYCEGDAQSTGNCMARAGPRDGAFQRLQLQNRNTLVSLTVKKKKGIFLSHFPSANN